MPIINHGAGLGCEIYRAVTGYVLHDDVAECGSYVNRVSGACYRDISYVNDFIGQQVIGIVLVYIVDYDSIAYYVYIDIAAPR